MKSDPAATPASRPPARADVRPADFGKAATISLEGAHALGWGVVALSELVATMSYPSRLPIELRMLHVVYEVGQLALLGAVSALAIRFWVRAPAPFRRRPRVALALAAFVVALPLTFGDLEGFVARQEGAATFLWYPAFAAAAAIGIALPSLLPASSRWRWPVLAVGVVASVANHVVLQRNYPGGHLLLAWFAAVLMGQGLVGLPLPWRVALPVEWRIGLLAATALTVVVPPPAGVRADLLASSGAVLAPYVAVYWAQLDGAATADSELARSHWFEPRDRLPAIPASPLDGLSRPIVLLVTVDAVRADQISDPATLEQLPTFQALTRESLYFTRVWSPSPSTFASMSSLLIGNYHVQQKWLKSKRSKSGRKYPDQDESPRLAELLDAGGVRSVHVVTHKGLKASHGIGRGFTQETMKAHWPHARDVTPHLIEQIEKAGEEPMFVFTHYLDPHNPYDRGGKSGSQRERHLAEIRVVDEQLGELIQAIDGSPHEDRIVLIISSDHGEAFHEHGAKYHATTLYEEMVRVPLFVRSARVAPRVIDVPVTLMDVPPTILDLFGVDTPAGFMGQSLVTYLAGRGAVLDRPIFIDSEIGMHAMVFPDGMKVIVHPKRGAREIYDLNEDPQEYENLADRPEAAKYFGAMEVFLDAHALSHRR